MTTAETRVGVQQWCVASKLDDLDAMLVRATKVARKLGVQPPSYEVLARKIVIHRDEVTGWEQPVEMVLVNIVDADLRLQGDWWLLAVVDHDTGLVFAVPGAPEGTVAQYQDCEPTCDHCGKSRQRMKTLVVENSDGERKRVGGQCVKDFLGHNASLTWALMRQWVQALTLDDDLLYVGGGSRNPTAYEMVVGATAVLQHSTYQAQGGTRDDVLLLLGARVAFDDAERERQRHLRSTCPITDKVRALADAAIDYCANSADQSDFALNLRAVARHADRSAKALGLAAYIPEAYRRALDKQAQQAADPAPRMPAPYGRTTLVGEVVRVSWQYDEYTNSEVKKLTVRDDRGFSVLFTEPRSVCCEQGDRLTVSVDIQARSNRDEAFGFGKRPTRAEVLTTANNNQEQEQ